MRSPFRTNHTIAVVAATVLFSTVLHGHAFAQTSVTLAFHGPLQERVRITTARLFVTAWAVSEDHDLPVEGNVVRLDLEATRPEFADRIADTSGFIYVKAAGDAPIISE